MHLTITTDWIYMDNLPSRADVPILPTDSIVIVPNNF